MVVTSDSSWVSRVLSAGLVRAGRYNSWQDAFEAIKLKSGLKEECPLCIS